MILTSRPISRSSRAASMIGLSSSNQADSASMDPRDIVAAQLYLLGQGEAGLRDAWGLMSPAYHERSDAFERFSMWFSSPLYESLLGCSDWKIAGVVSLRDEISERLLDDGTIFHATASVEQMVRVNVTPGRPKWAESGAVGTRLGQQLPTRTYLFTLSLHAEEPGVSLSPGGSWTIDQIVPEDTGRAPQDTDSDVGHG